MIFYASKKEDGYDLYELTKDELLGLVFKEANNDDKVAFNNFLEDIEDDFMEDGQESEMDVTGLYTTTEVDSEKTMVPMMAYLKNGEAGLYIEWEEEDE